MQGFADFSDSLLGGTILAGLGIAVGGVVWALPVLGVGRRPVDARVLRRTIALIGAGALGLALAQAAVLVLKAIVLSDYVGPDAYWHFLGTLQCRAGSARTLLALTLAAATVRLARAPERRGRWLLVAALAAAVTVSGACTSHAPLTVLHQLGAAVWVGGLVQLAALWPLTRRLPEADALWPLAVARFSRVALGALVVLLAAALPLTWTYVGSWDALVGTGYGSLVVTKAALMGAALLLAFGNRTAARGVRRGIPTVAVRGRVPYLVEAETILVVMLLFVAASLSSQPPPADTTGERATVAEVVEVFRPKWPSLRTPSVATMQADPSDPYAVHGGDRTVDAYRWSNFSHNVAGLLLLAMSAVALLGLGSRFGWARRHWPLGFAALAAFVYLRGAANDGTWPFGSAPLWGGDSEGLQHRIAAALALAIGLLEWRARGREAGRIPYVFPVLAAAGGLLLLTHAHTAFEMKRSFLIQVTHTTMGALAVVMACARLLELRLPAPGGRLAGAAATVAMLLIALVLVFYREANIVLPPG